MIKYYKEKLKIKISNIRFRHLHNRNAEFHNLDYEKKYAFIFFAADYNNLGDLAITVSQQRFLEDTIGSEYRVIKIYEDETFKWISEIKKLPVNNVLITLIGGGNSGSLYDFIENPRRYLLKIFRDYKIISFPQTIYFDNSETSKAIKEEFTRLADRCVNLTLLAREQNSEKIYRSITTARVLLVPDIVFYYEKYIIKKDDRNKNSLALVLRNDKEKLMTSSFQDELIKLCKKKFSKVNYMDTCDIEYHKDNAEGLLNDYLRELQCVSLVITDRLHGMILSYITKTPCIVFDNNNGKIKSTFETWLLEQDLIQIFDLKHSNFSELEKMMTTIVSKSDYNITDLNGRFLTFRNILEEQINARGSY